MGLFLHSLFSLSSVVLPYCSFAWMSRWFDGVTIGVTFGVGSRPGSIFSSSFDSEQERATVSCPFPLPPLPRSGSLSRVVGDGDSLCGSNCSVLDIVGPFMSFARASSSSDMALACRALALNPYGCSLCVAGGLAWLAFRFAGVYFLHRHVGSCTCSQVPALLLRFLVGWPAFPPLTCGTHTSLVMVLQSVYALYRQPAPLQKVYIFLSRVLSSRPILPDSKG